VSGDRKRAFGSPQASTPALTRRRRPPLPEGPPLPAAGGTRAKPAHDPARPALGKGLALESQAEQLDRERRGHCLWGDQRQAGEIGSVASRVARQQLHATDDGVRAHVEVGHG
jgi:hypothetical protein